MTQNKINFTKHNLEALSIPSAENDDVAYWDEKCRGLYVRVKSTGVKSFYVRRKIKGKSERLFIGRFPELSVENARAKACEFHAAVATGNNLADVRRAELAELTLGELFNEYLERHAKKSRQTWAVIQAEFQRNYGDWKTRKISTVTYDEVEKRHSTIATTRGKYAANRSVELLRAIFGKAIIWKLFKGENPAANITKFPEAKRSRILMPEEFERFFKALDAEIDVDKENNFKDFVKLSLLTGARKSNVLQMKWSDISLEAQTWTIAGEQMKNGQTQVIPLTAVEVSILRERLAVRDKKDESERSEFVFHGKGATGHFIEPKRQWNGLLKRARIQDLHLHDLRRSLASWMANTGANASLIQSALNHKDIKTTLTVYAHTVKDAERSAREKAHDFMLSFDRTNNPRVVPLHRKTDAAEMDNADELRPSPSAWH